MLKSKESGGDSPKLLGENGDHTFLSGEINKKSLYGWYEPANKLVELDVCNYHIN